MKSVFSSHLDAERTGVAERIRAMLADLPKQEARVAQYMLLNLDDLVFQNGVSVAESTGTSQVTVSRLLNRLGYRGMAGLKRELRASVHLGPAIDRNTRIEDTSLKRALDAEVRAIISVFSQTADPRWVEAVRVVADSRTVFVTGFQSVRGVAEDFARRLALVRDEVRFFSAHDGMLGEWVGDGVPRGGKQRDCMIIIDVVPYAQEAPVLAQISRDSGRDVVVISDEFCHWAQDCTELVFHAPSRNGLLLESTGALVSLANILVHGVAERDEAKTERRLRRWRSMTRTLNVF